ncbi:MAG TPA: DUF6065 family protein [Acetobacteraceae bacterium]|nr:DUF6065 family protein [Acetobacteraceae bacterium]
MDLICYLRPGWDPTIRPAEPTREWMDQTRHSFAYRCLPLSIANAHGWEILNPIAFDAEWNGGPRLEDVVLRLPPDTPERHKPVSIFGAGVLTFHINGLFRTPPGWNLWVGGSPNRPKDAIYPLTGVIETDWSPYGFTMNWRFTRPHRTVHFAAGEPICFLFPIQRALLDNVHPRFLPLDTEEQLSAHNAVWSHARTEFHKMLRESANDLPTRDQWQKHYFRGVDMTNQPVVPDHLSKLRATPFRPIEAGRSTEASPNAPIHMQTDTATLGRAIGAVARAMNREGAEPAADQAALARQLMMLGLGESEAVEVVWAACDEGRSADQRT